MPHEARRNPSGYGILITIIKGSVIGVIINNPPLNLCSYRLAADFFIFIRTVAETVNTSDVKISILSSARLDVFIDHIDIHGLSAASSELSPASSILTGI